MGDRTWAAFGNVLKILSLPLFLGSVVGGYRVVEFAQIEAPTNLLVLAVALALIGLVVAVLFWMAKGPLISGNVVARFLVGLYMLLWVISSLGFALIFILIVYLFTSDPEPSRGVFEARKPAKPTFTPPPNWQATGRVGPSGAMVYSNAEQDGSVDSFDSWLPVQVIDRRGGLAHVVAATGQGGWIDVRTLTEGV